MTLSLDPPNAVPLLGIDDFALRRGRKYGTVLVDLTRHRVIDLFPDRKAETAKAWIQAHPEIKWKSILNNLRLVLQPYVYASFLFLWLLLFDISSLRAGLAELVAIMNSFHAALPT